MFQIHRHLVNPPLRNPKLSVGVNSAGYRVGGGASRVPSPSPMCFKPMTDVCPPSARLPHIFWFILGG